MSIHHPIHHPKQTNQIDPAWRRLVSATVGSLVLWCASIAAAQEMPVDSAYYPFKFAAEALKSEIDMFPSRQAAWEKQIDWESIDQQLEQEADAEPAVLKKLAAGLSKLETPVDQTRLYDLQRTLRGWSSGIDSQEDVEESIDALAAWAKQSKSRGFWANTFRLRELAKQVAADKPDRDEIKEIQDLLDAESTYLSRQKFERLRRAMQDYAAELEFPVDSDLAKSVRRAKSTFQAPFPSTVYSAQQETKQALTNLQNYLQSVAADDRKAWTEQLKLEELSEELNAEGTPRGSIIASAFSRFDAGDSQFRKPIFRQTRDKLKKYLELLQFSERQPSRAQEERQLLRFALDELDRYLIRGGARREKGWKKYLGWEELQALTTDTSPSIKAMNGLYKKITADENGLDDRRFERVARRLSKYREVLQLSQGPKAQDLYTSRIEKLARAVETHSLDPSADSAAEVTSTLLWLNSTGMQPGLSSQVVGEFTKPNVYIAVSGRWVSKRMSDFVRDCQNVNRMMDGSVIRGTARTSAQVNGTLVPAVNGAIVDVLLNGSTVTRTVATQRRVNVSTVGNTSLFGTKRIYLTPQGLGSYPAVANASSNTQICNVQVNRNCGRRLIGRIARRRAAESLPKANTQLNQEARQSVSERMDREAEELIARANQQFRETQTRIREQLAELELGDEVMPQQITMRSTADHIEVDALALGGLLLGAPSMPPKVGRESDVAILFHESAVNNLLASQIAGLKLTSEEVVDLLKSRGMPIPEELQPKPAEDGEEPEDESWSITFDDAQPASLRLTDGKARIGIRAKKFTQGDQKINEPIEISTEYRLRKTPTGQLEAIRIDEIDIRFVKSPGRLSTRQLTYKTFLKRKTGALFPPKLSADDLPNNEITQRLKTLVLDSIESTRGWLAISMGLDALIPEDAGF